MMGLFRTAWSCGFGSKVMGRDVRHLLYSSHVCCHCSWSRWWLSVVLVLLYGCEVRISTPPSVPHSHPIIPSHSSTGTSYSMSPFPPSTSRSRYVSSVNLHRICKDRITYLKHLLQLLYPIQRRIWRLAPSSFQYQVISSIFSWLKINLMSCVSVEQLSHLNYIFIANIWLLTMWHDIDLASLWQMHIVTKWQLDYSNLPEHLFSWLAFRVAPGVCCWGDLFTMVIESQRAIYTSTMRRVVCFVLFWFVSC